jgi:DNA-binding CsgD family transcriptional regulator/PAS domain-containing protein
VKELRGQTGGSYAHIIFRTTAQATSETFEVSDYDEFPVEFRRSYTERFSEIDPFPYFEMRPGVVYRTADLMGAEEFENHPYYKGYLKPAGLESLLLFQAREPSGYRAWVTIARRLETGAFNEADVAMCKQLEPHIENALRVFAAFQRLELERDIYRHVAGTLAWGVLLLNQHGQICEIDAVAEKIIGSTALLRVSNERLRATDHKNDLALQALIKGLLAGPNDRTAVFRLSNAPQLDLTFRVLQQPIGWMAAGAPRVAVYVSSTTAGSFPSIDVISQLFGLSKTEASLTLLLAQGRTLTEAAVDLNIAESTARTYSKRIYSKTGVTRQTDLVRQILTSVSRAS